MNGFFFTRYVKNKKTNDQAYEKVLYFPSAFLMPHLVIIERRFKLPFDFLSGSLTKNICKKSFGVSSFHTSRN